MTIFTWSEFDVNPSLVAFLFAASGFLLLLAGVCVVSVLFFAALLLIFKQNIGPINKFMANFMVWLIGTKLVCQIMLRKLKKTEIKQMFINSATAAAAGSN